MRLGSDIEAGPARTDELDTMLEIMCEAFEMPFAAARDIFYSDPYFSLPNKRVLRVGGRVVSCLTIVEARCWIGKSVVPIAGIAGVATQKVRRGRGYAGRLLEATLQDLRQQQYPLTALIPFSYRYYRKFGWELAGMAHRMRVSPMHLPFSPETSRVRPAQAEDVEAMCALYEWLAVGRTFHCLRDADRWRYILNHVKQKVVYQDEQGDVQGYLLYEVQPGRMEQLVPPVVEPPTLRVLEMRSASPAGWRGLIGHLAEQKQAGQILYTTTPEDLMACGLHRPDQEVEDGNALATVEVIPAMMTRIVSLSRMLQNLIPNWTDPEAGDNTTTSLDIRLSDPRTPSGKERVVLSLSSDGAITVEPSRAGTSLAKPLPFLEGDVKVWSQVLIGFIGAEEACARGLLSASSPQAAALAARLFPPRAPFLPIPDHF